MIQNNDPYNALGFSQSSFLNSLEAFNSSSVKTLGK